MRIDNIIRYRPMYLHLFVFLFFLGINPFLFSTEVEDEIEMLREAFNKILEYKEGDIAPETLYKEVTSKMKDKDYAWHNIKDDKAEVGVYLHIWRIKSLFLIGEIDSAQIWFNGDKEEKTHKPKEGKIIEILSLTDKTDDFTKNLCIVPYSDKLSNCSKECMCIYLDEKYDNLDFLKEENLSENFVNIKIQIDNGLNEAIQIDRKSYAREDAEKKIKVLLSPPFANFTKYTDYSLDDEVDEIMEYYFTKARENRLDILREKFDNKETDLLVFDQEGDINGERTYYYLKSHIPLVPRYSDRNIFQLYQLYVGTQENKNKYKYLTRYSFNLLDTHKNKGKNKDIYLRWNNKWQMAELPEKGHIFLLFPKSYIYQGNQKSAFKIGPHNLFTRDPLNIKRMKDDGIRIQKNIDQEYAENYYGITSGKLFNQDNPKTPEIEGYVEVVPVEIIFTDGEELELELSEDFEEYEEDKRKIDKEQKRFWGVMLVCIAFLLLPL